MSAVVINIDNGHLDHSFLVGNLSFFCKEEELLQWFGEYGEVTRVQLFRANGVMAIITMTSSHGADEMVRLFHGQFFMGRHLRLKRCIGEIQERMLLDNNPDIEEQELPTGHFICIEMSSNFMPSQLILPTEVVLRKYFLSFGAILDVEVLHYEHDEMTATQQGRATITYRDASSVNNVRSFAAIHFLDGIIITLSPRPLDQ